MKLEAFSERKIYVGEFFAHHYIVHGGNFLIKLRILRIMLSSEYNLFFDNSVILSLFIYVWINVLGHLQQKKTI